MRALTWLRRRKVSTGNPFRRLSLPLVIKYRANIVCAAPYFKTRRRQHFCGSWPTQYGEKHPIQSNFLWTDVLLRSPRILQHCVYNGDKYVKIRHRTRDVKAGSACWVVRPRSDNNKRRVLDASMKPMISVNYPLWNYFTNKPLTLKMWLPFRMVALY